MTMSIVGVLGKLVPWWPFVSLFAGALSRIKVRDVSFGLGRTNINQYILEHERQQATLDNNQSDNADLV